MTTTTNEKPGRKSPYQPEFAELARKVCLLGATDEQLGEVLKVSRRTILNWRKQHPDFDAAIAAGKDEADARVADALYQRALGFSHPDEEIKIVANEVVRVPTVKRYPPDTVSCIFWLKNRRPDLWRDKHEVAHQDDRDKEMATIAELDALYEKAMVKMKSEQERVKREREPLLAEIDATTQPSASQTRDSAHPKSPDTEVSE